MAFLMDWRSAGGLVLVLAALLLPASAASAYEFGEPDVRQVGPESVPFDWSANKCTNDDIPDQPARAFREANGTINLVDTHHTGWRNTTSNLVTLNHRCSPLMMTSGNNGDPSKYDDKEWIGSTWTPDGTTVYALVHEEYQGWRHSPNGYCVRSGETSEERGKCWYNSITMMTSTNGGSTFTHTTPPSHLVASSPLRYEPGIGPIGFFQPSNIVRAQDGWHYFVSRVHSGTGPQATGTCLLRTRNVADPTSWRGWSGTGFTKRFPSPYVETLDPAQHTCQPVQENHVATRSESLMWNTYFKKWMLVGSGLNADGVSGTGFYYHTSDDLINWTDAKILMKGPLPWEHDCDGEVLRDPSLLDPESKTRNFDTVGQRPYLFFTRFHLTGCSWSLDRDLVRIPIEFSNQVSGGPSAALTASTTSASTGEPVTFDASGSRDEDGSITRYEWDLDGDGSYERDSGTTAVVSHTYDGPGAVTVTVRVHDDDGKATDDTTVVEVSGAGQAGGAASTAGSELPGALGRTSAAAAREAVGRFTIVRRRAARARAVVRVRVPAAGVLKVRAAGRVRAIRPARASASAAGLVRMTVRASRAGRQALARRSRVRVRARFAFTPVGGARQTRVRTLTLAR